MGLFGSTLARRLLTLAGLLLVVLGIVVPWPVKALREILLVLGLGLMLSQVTMSVRSATRFEPDDDPDAPESPGRRFDR